MNDEQFQAWLDQHGGEVGRKNNEKQIDGPADPQTGQPTKQTAVDSTTITAADGATLTLRRTPGPINGGHDYEEVGRTPPKKQPATQTGTTGSNPRVPAGATSAIEGTPIGPLDAQGNPVSGQYDNSQPIRAWHNPDGSIFIREVPQASDGDYVQWQRNKNGGLTDAEVEQARTRQQEQNRGTTQLKPDGRGGTLAVTTYPDGRAPTTVPVPGVPSEATSKYTEVKQDPQTGAWSGFTRDGRWEAIAGGPGVARKPGQIVPINGESYWATPNDDPSQPPTLTRIDPSHPPQDDGPSLTPGMAPSEYLQQRRAWLMQQRQAGVSLPEVKEIWDRDVQLAIQRQNEANTAATQQNQRLSAASSGFGQDVATITDLNRYLPQGSDLGGKALDALLTLRQGFAQRMGGYGAPPGPLAVPPPPADPSAQVAAIPPPPNAIGAGSIGSVPAPGGNAAPAAPRTLPEPIFRPQPPAAPPTPVNPPAGAPGNDPTQPVGMAPAAAPVSAIPENPYDFAQRVAATPPWQMTEDDYRQAQAMGLGNAFWSLPGRGAA